MIEATVIIIFILIGIILAYCVHQILFTEPSNDNYMFGLSFSIIAVVFMWITITGIHNAYLDLVEYINSNLTHLAQ